MTTDVLIGIGVAVGLLVLLGLVVGVTLLLGLVTGLLWWLEHRRQRMEPGGGAAASRSLPQRAVHAWAAVVGTVMAAVAMPEATPRMGTDEPTPAPTPEPTREPWWKRLRSRE